MAEYVEVATQKSRMCRLYEMCSGCPLCGKGICNKSCENMTSDDFRKEEEIVTKWAKEYKESDYPTWREYLFSDFLIWCRLKCQDIEKYEKAWFDYLCNTRIPAEIAEKLGLKRKEV